MFRFFEELLCLFIVILLFLLFKFLLSIWFILKEGCWVKFMGVLNCIMVVNEKFVCFYCVIIVIFK